MDEKEIDLKIEKEMVDLFIISNRKERTLWELERPRKRSDGLSRFFFGTYLNQNLFKALSIGRPRQCRIAKGDSAIRRNFKRVCDNTRSMWLFFDKRSN